MTSQLIPSLIVDPVATVRKERELPVAGELLCQIGETVEPTTIVAKAELPGDLIILKIAEKLGIEPHEVVRGLKVAVADRVSEGQLLCQHSGIFGLFKSRFCCPAAGVIEFIAEATGHVGLRLAARQLEVRAHIAGTVVATRPQRSVTVETSAVLIQGIFGIGGERLGQLQLVVGSEREEIIVADLPADLAGKVLVTSTWASGEVLKAAAQGGAHGFILGSLDDNAISQYLGYDIGIALTGNEAVSMSVIVTEGFGRLRMATRTQALFSELVGCQVALDGTTQVRAGAVRPEVIIFAGEEKLSAFKKEERNYHFLEGAVVRIIRSPYFGEVATVVSAPPELQRIETGAKTRVLIVRRQGGDEVVVPRVNVELL